MIDVGYAGVIGAQRIVDGKPLYGALPDRQRTRRHLRARSTTRPTCPFQQIFGWSGTWDDLPAAHAAAIFFDLLAVALLFLIGRRMRGPTLGIALAYAWVSFPFTLFALESNSNDTLVAVARAGGAARRDLPLDARRPRARRARRARRADEVRAAGARAAARDRRRCAQLPRAAPAARSTLMFIAGFLAAGGARC